MGELTRAYEIIGSVSWEHVIIYGATILGSIVFIKYCATHDSRKKPEITSGQREHHASKVEEIVNKRF